ncbi:hypothetical protein [Bacillus cereus group sp. BfR-BA-01494]
MRKRYRSVTNGIASFSITGGQCVTINRSGKRGSPIDWTCDWTV